MPGTTLAGQGPTRTFSESRQADPEVNIPSHTVSKSGLLFLLSGYYLTSTTFPDIDILHPAVLTTPPKTMCLYNYYIAYVREGTILKVFHPVNHVFFILV